MNAYIDAKEARQMIAETHGKIFSVEFIKRTTGELRKMTCRTEVTSKLKGGEKPYKDEDHQLVTVYDIHAEGYRTIPLEQVIRIKIDGRVYKMNPMIEKAFLENQNQETSKCTCHIGSGDCPVHGKLDKSELRKGRKVRKP